MSGMATMEISATSQEKKYTVGGGARPEPEKEKTHSALCATAGGTGGRVVRLGMTVPAFLGRAQSTKHP